MCQSLSRAAMRHVSGRNDADRRKIGLDASCIAGEKLRVFHNRVGTDEEVRQNAGFGAALLAISPKRMSGKKQREFWRWCSRNGQSIECQVQFKDIWKARRQLCIDDLVDGKCVTRLCKTQRDKRTVLPDWVLGKDIDQDVGIDEYQSSPRISFMNSSVVIPPRSNFARARRSRFSNSLSGTFFAGLTMAAPWSNSTVTFVPGFNPAASRTRLGMVTWPLLVTVVVVMKVLPCTLQVILSELASIFNRRPRRGSVPRANRRPDPGCRRGAARAPRWSVARKAVSGSEGPEAWPGAARSVADRSLSRRLPPPW